MEIRILLFLFLLTLFITNDVNAKWFGSRGWSSRGSSSRGWSFRGSSSGHSSGSSSTRYGNSLGRHTSIPHTIPGRPHTFPVRPHTFPVKQSDILPVIRRTSLSSTRDGSSSDRHGIGSSSTGTLPSQTSHQQNKDVSTSILHAERGNAIRPSQTNSAQPSVPVVNRGNAGTHPGSQVGKPDFATENKQNAVPYNPSAPYNPYNPSAPSAPSADHLSKANVVPSQSHVSTPLGQPSTPYTPHGNIHNPSWNNPYFNPNQPYPNIGIKDNLRPTTMPLPSNSVPPYPRTTYPISNPHSSPYPFDHSTYNPNQAIGHPSSYPAHIPAPVPGTFGNPYSTHPVGGTYGTAGHSYYPQQHVLAQPAAQPYIPGQTVIMVPGQQDSGRGFGQMVKEALVFSTINAGVNRLINPHQHYIPDYNRPASASTTASETHITYNNHYINTAPSDNTPSVPASSNIPQENVPVTNPVNYPSPVINPVITPGVSIPTFVGNNGSVTYPANNGSFVNTVGTTNNMEGSPNGFSVGNTVNSQREPVNSQETTVYSPQNSPYRISDNDLLILTEELFAKQEVNISKYLTLHLQNKSENVTDAAKGPLIYAQPEIYDYPTILVIRALYDNYEHNSTIKENRTLEKRKEEDLLLDVFLNTNIMTKAMQWLSDRGFIDPDDFEKKDTLRHIWFSQFDGATSGFERVFTSERYGADLLGVQDWIYFDYQESKGRIDYMGYIDTLKLGDRASLLKLNFKMDDIIRPNATIFVGTFPELEMSLYTICFYARPNDLCPVSLGGTKFNIFTHSFRYYGKDLIDLALPIF